MKNIHEEDQTEKQGVYQTEKKSDKVLRTCTQYLLGKAASEEVLQDWNMISFTSFEHVSWSWVLNLVEFVMKDSSKAKSYVG